MKKSERIAQHKKRERDAVSLAKKYLGTKDYEDAAKWAAAANTHAAVVWALESQ